MTEEKLKELLESLRSLPSETEWLEFKEAKANFDFNKLGKYFSALSNNLNPPPTFLEPGGDGCELRVTSCEVKNFSVVFLPQFFKVLPRKPATRDT